MELSQSTCRAELESNHLVPRKYHGQVFTTDPTVVDQFIETVRSVYKPGTKIVEIGGGLGYLTDPLIRNFDDVDCLEIDEDLLRILATKFCPNNKPCHSDQGGGMNKKIIHDKNSILNTKVIQDDKETLNNILVHNEIVAENKQKQDNLNKISIQNNSSEGTFHSKRSQGMNNKIIQNNKNFRLLREDILEYEPNNCPYLLVGNIPFHLSGRLYRKFMSEIDHKPYGMVFITDRQYARTLMGQPPRCYRVSLQAQAYGKIEIVADVPPASVYPPPKVNCCIMKITYNPKKLPSNFWKVVNHHFDNFPTAEVKSPKTLSLLDWIQLAEETQI